MGIGAIEQSASKRRKMQASERAELLELGLDFEEAEAGMMYHPDDDDNTGTQYYGMSGVESPQRKTGKFVLRLC
jgi:hypothetical protein